MVAFTLILLKTIWFGLISACGLMKPRVFNFQGSAFHLWFIFKWAPFFSWKGYQVHQDVFPSRWEIKKGGLLSMIKSWSVWADSKKRDPSFSKGQTKISALPSKQIHTLCLLCLGFGDFDGKSARELDFLFQLCIIYHPKVHTQFLCWSPISRSMSTA